MKLRQYKQGRKINIGMACLTTEEQVNLAIKMINKTNRCVVS